MRKRSQLYLLLNICWLHGLCCGAFNILYSQNSQNEMICYYFKRHIYRILDIYVKKITNNIQERNMLIRFAVENFMSFRDEQIFSMVAGKHTRHPLHIASVNGRRILKGSFIFGANASGKSNFIKAIYAAKRIVLHDLNAARIERSYFRLDPESREKNCVFQFDIFAEGSFYSYGYAFSYCNKEIVSEWLYRIEDGDELCVFERDIQNGRTSIITHLDLSEDNKYRLRIYGEDLPKDRTFLNEIARKEVINTEQFTPFRDVWKWFCNLIVILPDMRISYEGYNQIAADSEFHHILSALDTGIRSISVREESLDKVFRSLPDSFHDMLAFNIESLLNKSGSRLNITISGELYSFYRNGEDIAVMKQLMDHGNADELFSYGDESDGTKRLFDLLPYIADKGEPKVILIDEIDRSFHTNLVIRYIGLFYERSKGHNMQLIATLHDVNLMNFDIVRQDEIWFATRNEATGASSLYSLNRFQIRFDKKIIKDYLLGRYGSIPCFGQVDDEDEDGISE